MTRSYVLAGVMLCFGCTSSETSPSDSAASSDSTPAPPSTTQPPPATDAETFRAVGQEPGWLLTISDSLRLQWDYDASRVVVATPTLQRSSAERKYEFMHRDTAFTVRISNSPCADAMSGHQYPSTVSVQIAERVLNGCGGAPGEMLQGAQWSVDSLDGKSLVDASTITLQFSADGSVSGTAGCNRYRGSYQAKGSELTFGPAMSTKMSCGPGVDQQEARFLSALREPLRYYVENGALHLTRDNSVVVTARRQ